MPRRVPCWTKAPSARCCESIRPTAFSTTILRTFATRPEAGGGALGDIGVYAFGSVRLLTGQEPQEILAAEIEMRNGVDVSAHVMARFSGFLYTGRVSMRAAPWQEIVIHGETGVIRMPVPYNAQVFGEARIALHRPGGHDEIWRFPSANHYVLQVEAFNRAVRDGSDWPVPLEQSRGTRALLDAILAAAG